MPFYIETNPSEKDFSASTAYFPVVGIVLGAVAAAVFYIASPLGKDIASLLTFTVYVYLALGFHLDGLADCFDGLAAGKRGEEMMNIMKDSRIGTFAAISLFLASAFYLKLFTYANYDALLIFPVVGRYTMTVTAAAFKPARKEGLGYLFSNEAGLKEFILSSVFTIIAGAAVMETGFLLPAACAVAAALIFVRNISSRLGGVNGDIMGASLVLSEIIFLLTAYAEGVIW